MNDTPADSQSGLSRRRLIGSGVAAAGLAAAFMRRPPAGWPKGS